MSSNINQKNAVSNRTVLKEYMHSFNNAFHYMKHSMEVIVNAEKRVSRLLPIQNNLLAEISKCRIKIKFSSVIIQLQHQTLENIQIISLQIIARPLNGKRRIFEEETTVALRELYELDTHPTSQVMDIFAKRHRITLHQVQNWFRLRRHRDKKRSDGEYYQPAEELKPATAASFVHPPPQISSEHNCQISTSQSITFEVHALEIDFMAFESYFVQ
jgi:hypothetical protein